MSMEGLISYENYYFYSFEKGFSCLHCMKASKTSLTFLPAAGGSFFSWWAAWL